MRAIGEIHRVLEPGGLMIAAEVYVSEEDARALPPAVRELFQNRFPFIFKNYREECRAAGFRDIRDEVIGRFSTATSRPARARSSPEGFSPRQATPALRPASPIPMGVSSTTPGTR